MNSSCQHNDDNNHEIQKEENKIRIISPTHDYYDGLQAYDEDRQLIYQRKAELVKFKHAQPWDDADKSKFPFPICDACRFRYVIEENTIDQRIIGFCGRIYPTLFINKKGVTGTRTACNTIEDVDAFVKANYSSDDYNAYAKKARYQKFYLVFGRRAKLKEWFDLIEAKKDSYRESLFESRHCPIFVAWATPSNLSIEYNANLKDTGFVKQFEPWSAYQEIRMFLGGLACPEKAIPEPDDRIKAESHGFDKYSFRKDKQE